MVDFLFVPDSFLMFVHDSVKSFIHAVFQFVLEVCLHIHNHRVDVLTDSLVL